MEKEGKIILDVKKDSVKIKAKLNEIEKEKKAFKEETFFYKKEIDKMKLQ